MSVRFVLAARLYAASMRLIHDRADLAYLLLTEAVETLATEAIDAEHAVRDSGEQPPRKFRALAENRGVPAETACELWAACQGRKRGPTFQFRQYLCEYTPAALWTTPDDLFHTERMAGIIPAPGDLKEVLGMIYGQRSKFLHSGSPYPAWITLGIGAKVSPQAFFQGLRAAASRKIALPPVAWFARMVQMAILEHLRRTT